MGYDRVNLLGSGWGIGPGTRQAERGREREGEKGSVIETRSGSGENYSDRKSRTF